MIVRVLVFCLFLTGCLPHRSPILERAWSLDEGVYQFEDFRLQLKFQLGERQFSWRFRNKTGHTLTIRHQEAFLVLDGDERSYSLWGAPVEERSVPPITVHPGGFVALTYPVKFNSPLYPFRVAHDGQVGLFLTLHQDDQVWTYHLPFPKTSGDAVTPG